MVDGWIIANNSQTGATSWKQAADTENSQYKPDQGTGQKTDKGDLTGHPQPF